MGPSDRYKSVEIDCRRWVRSHMRLAHYTGIFGRFPRLLVADAFFDLQTQFRPIEPWPQSTQGDQPLYVQFSENHRNGDLFQSNPIQNFQVGCNCTSWSKIRQLQYQSIANIGIKKCSGQTVCRLKMWCIEINICYVLVPLASIFFCCQMHSRQRAYRKISKTLLYFVMNESFRASMPSLPRRLFHQREVWTIITWKVLLSICA